MRVHHINNINKALQVIHDHGIKLVNISSNDIESGNEKLILGLIWLIALNFDGKKLVNSQAVSGIEKSLLTWVNTFTELHGLRVNDFSSSWSDGLAFLYLLHENIPAFDLQSAIKLHPIARLRMAFDLASRQLQIEQLLDPEDVNTIKPDKKSILMYIMCIYNAIDSKKQEQTGMRQLAEHAGSTEEMQLLDEEIDSNRESKRASRVSSDCQEIGAVHPGNLTELDEISLAKSIEDLRQFRSEDAPINPTNVNIVRSIEHTELPTSNLRFDENRLSGIDLVPSKDTPFAWEQKGSRPASTATNFSIEITSYEAAVEEVLTLLLKAEEIISRDLPIAGDLGAARQQFHDHEDFMLKLAEHQSYVGAALEEGSRLISESQNNSGGLSVEEQDEIKHQLILLNERWETLRVRALDVQSKIHSRLAELQLEKIEELKNFLTATEDRISHMSNIGPGPEELKLQLEEHVKLQKDLESLKIMVDGLSNLVVIVDSDHFSDLEDRLSALEERWSHVLKWTAKRWEKLQNIKLCWIKLSIYYKIIFRWTESRERTLKALEGREVKDIGAALERINYLNYCTKDLMSLQNALQELDQIIQVLQQNGCTAQEVSEKIEHLNDKCDALKNILDIQQMRIENIGFNIPQRSKTAPVHRPNSWEDFESQLHSSIGQSNFDVETVELRPISLYVETEVTAKKRKIEQSEDVVRLNESINEMINFLQNIEYKFDDYYRHDLKSKPSYLDLLSQEVKRKASVYSTTKQLLEKCRTEPNTDISIEETQVTDICTKYDQINHKLEDLNVKLKEDLYKDRFYRSLTGFKLVLADLRDWFNGHSHQASKQDLQTKLNNMESLNRDIQETRDLCIPENSVEYSNWLRDLDQFMESWNDMKRAIMRLVQDKGGLDYVNTKIKDLDRFIAKVNESPILYSSVDKMDQNLESLKRLSTEYNELNDIFEHVYEKSSVETIGDLIVNWEKTVNVIHDKVIQQETAIEALNHFKTEYAVIEEMINKMEATLKTDIFIFGEILELHEKLKTYEKLTQELKKIEIEIISIKSFNEILIKNSENEHREALMEKIQHLNDRETELKNLHRNNLQKLNHVITQSEELLAQVDEMEAWLNDLETNTPKSRIADIYSPNEIFQVKSKFQSLKDACEQQTIKFRELNETGSEILLQIDDLIQKHVLGRASFLAKRFTKLNARWNEVTSAVYNQTALLEHISSLAGEFKTLIAGETGYFDKLEKVLRKSPESAADAEEISEELDVSIV